MYLPTYETFTSELHPRNDDDLELAPAELDGVTTMYSVCAPRARMLGAEAQAQAKAEFTTTLEMQNCR